MMKKQTTVTTLPRVLIVDDDAMVRLLAISALGQLDLDLHEAGDGQTCLRPRDRFWGLGCPKIYHEAEDTLAAALRNGTRAARGGGFLEELHRTRV